MYEGKRHTVKTTFYFILLFTVFLFTACGGGESSGSTGSGSGGGSNSSGPTVAGFYPEFGPAGTPIVIGGTNFDPVLANNIVKLNGVPATVTSATSTRLIVTIPTGATTGQITVQTPAGTVIAGKNFTLTTSIDRIYVANTAFSSLGTTQGSISVINATTNAVATTIPYSGWPTSVRMLSNPIVKSLYLPGFVGSWGSSYTINLWNIDTNNNTSNTANLGSWIDGAINPVNNRLYMTTGTGIGVIDLINHTNTGGISFGASTSNITVNPITNRVYVLDGPTWNSNTQHYNDDGTLWIVDLTNNSVIGNVSMKGYNYLHDLTADPIANRLYVLSGRGYLGSNLNISALVVVIDTSNNIVIKTIPLNTNSPIAIASNPVTNRVYAVNYSGGSASSDPTSVSVIDTTTDTVIANIHTGIKACAADIHLARNRIYVANAGDNTVSVIDGIANTIIATVPVGLNPCGVAVNP